MGCLLFIAALPARGQDVSGFQAVSAVEKSLTDAIARSERSVVAIARVHRDQPGETARLEFRPDPFDRRVLAPTAPQPGDANFVPNEYATGVVVDRRGLILTAYHVLGEVNDSDYFITASDRKFYHARVRAADPRSDLAVLSIDGADVNPVNLPPIALGDSAGLRKGQIVVTLGNPYAIARDGQASAGWGIVSNLGRKTPAAPSDSELNVKRTLHHFGTLIQTDAKLNLGASGGALVNLRGEMVGLCVALGAVAGYESAAGYAIPVDATFRRVLEVLKQGREVEYGFLGIQPVNLQPSEILSGLHGTRVDRVVTGAPAARYGLRDNDIITAVDGKAIYDADGLVLNVGRLPVEAVTHLEVLRSGQKTAVDVVLTKYPVLGKKVVTVQDPAWRGLRVDYASAVIEGGLGRIDDAVAIIDVEKDSPAQTAGARKGMLVSHVGDRPVRTPKEFCTAVAGRVGAVPLRLVDSETTGLVVPAR